MLKVVIVEDEELVRQGIVLAVDWAGMDCVVVGEAKDGVEGMKVITDRKPDLVITDVKMPYMDGVMMIEQLKEQQCKSQFIILTAYSDFSYAHSALKLGVTDYLLKPFEDEELEQAVAKARQRLNEQHTLKETETPLFRFDVDKGAKSKYIEEAIVYIRNHYNEELTSGSVADSIGLSEGYLSRTFKKETSYTFINYLINYRIHMAMQLLRDCHAKVYEVAEQVGYSDTTHFSALFKKVVGISPSEYQDRCN